MELAVENPSCAGSEGPGNVLTNTTHVWFISVINICPTRGLYCCISVLVQ